MKRLLVLHSLLWAMFGTEVVQSEVPVQRWFHQGPRASSFDITEVVIDSNGDVVMAGTAFTPGVGTDYYTAKYAGNTGSLIWEQRYDRGSQLDDLAHALVLDQAGNVLVGGAVTGNSASLDFHVVKYRAADGMVLWERQYNGSLNQEDVAQALAVDSGGNVFAGGQESTNTIAGRNAYFAKYSPLGQVLWEHHYDGPAHGADSVEAIASDSAGNALVVGRCPSAATKEDIYIGKYTAAGGVTLWERCIDGPGHQSDVARYIAIDGTDNLVIAGSSQDSRGKSDVFVGKYAANTGATIWEQRVNGTDDGADAARAVALDASGNVFVAGYLNGGGNNADIYVAKLLAADGAVLWSRRISGEAGRSDVAESIKIDAFGNPVMLGFLEHSGSKRPYYIAKFSSTDGATIWTQEFGGPGGALDYPRGLAIGSSGEVLVTGTVWTSTTFEFDTVKIDIIKEPDVTTGVAHDVTTTTAILQAIVNPNRADASPSFEYGLGTGYGSDVSATPSPVTGAESTTVSATISGLLPHTLYHYRAKATNIGGTGLGLDATFTTANTPPLVVDDRFHPTLPGPFRLDVLGTDTPDSDSDGDPLTIVTVTGSGHGNVSTDGAAVFYTPGATYDGNDVFQYTVADGYGGTGEGQVTLHNAPPIAGDDVALAASVGPVPVPVLQNDSDLDGDDLTVLAARDGSWGTVTTDGTTVTYLPGPKFPGVDAFTYTVGDGFGGSAIGRVTVRATFSVTLPLAVKGDAVPGAGVSESGVPLGAAWRTFGVPSLMEAGASAGWMARATADEGSFTGIFSGPLGAPVLRARTFATAPDASGNPLPGVVFTMFREPVFGGAESYVLHGTVLGIDVNRANATRLWAATASTPLREIARVGGPAPGTAARFAAFTSIAMPGPNAAFFTAMLRGNVSSRDDRGLWMWTPESGVTLRLREGQPFVLGTEQKTVSSFRVIDTVSGSSGHGRMNQVEGAVFARLKFTDGLQSAVPLTIAPLAAHVDSGKPIIGVVPMNFYTPDFRSATDGSALLRAEMGTTLKTVDQAVLDYGLETLVARTDHYAPGGNGAVFRTFEDPVTSVDQQNRPVDVFKARLSDGSTGIWSYGGAGPSLTLVARTGDEFAKFTSLSAMHGRGALFTAMVVPDGKSGMWAVDSTGVLLQLFREGDPVAGHVLQAFTVLGAVSGSPGQRRAWAQEDSIPRILWRGFFTDGTSAILTTTVP